MMNSCLVDSLSGLLNFCVYFGTSLLLLLVFCRIYCWATPYDEVQMVREGKTAPAISFGGALIGFALPLASAISHSVSLFDMLIWGVIALVIQITVFSAVRIMYKDLVTEIQNNHAAAATLLAFLSITIGILNAASMTY